MSRISNRERDRLLNQTLARLQGAAALLDLFDRRYDGRARTILTVNITVETFRQRYGQDGGRFLDRLRESGEWFNVAGESMRRPGGVR